MGSAHPTFLSDSTGLTQDYDRLARDPNANSSQPPNGQFTHPSYLKTIGYNPSNPNYAIELQGGDTLIHNAFVIPENGRLRFNVHIDDPAQSNDQSNFIQMFLIDESGNEVELSGLPLATPSFIIPNDAIKSPTDGTTVVAIDLREVKPGINAVQPMQGQINRLAFGSYGFETFSADIPAEMRGKVAKLKIVVNGSKKVYLDDIFFGSEHLLPGNLTNAKGDLEANLNLTNFLLEKPGYALSYNNDLKTANWVSYKLDRSWMNSDAVDVRPNKFNRDFQLNSLQSNNSYPKFTVVDFNAIDGENSGYQRGHVADARQRERIATSQTNGNDNIFKDYYSTFVMSNVFPEYDLGKISKPDPWVDLAIFLSSTLVGTYNQTTQQFTGKDKDLYIIAGRDGDTTATGVNVSVPEFLWRVVLVLNHGQKLADATKDNMAFAVYMPNDASRGNIINWRDNQYFTSLMSVADLEQKLKQSGNNFDFFSNLPTQTRSQIKTRNYTEIYNWIVGGVYPLLAEEEQSTSSPYSITTRKDTLPISESSGSLKEAIDTSCTRKITLNPDGTVRFTTPLEIGISQIGISKNNIFQATSSKVDVATVNVTAKTGISEIGSSQIRSIDTNTIKSSSEETSTTEIGITYKTSIKGSTSQVDVAQVSPIQMSYGNFSEGEISSPSSIETQDVLFFQAFGVQHNVGYQVQKIELAAISLWQQQLHSTTPIDLNFEITNLPTGHLAEGTITSYNTNGTPKTATITIDDDANGVGWFVDSTPGDSSEFQGVGELGSEGVGEYFQAAPNSSASGKYDLLTAILHEMGHTLGIINGYSEFDKHIKNGIFTTDTFTTKLTPDGSHLDSTLYPYDLMNTSLKPGVRKLPSKMDWAIINALNSGIGSGVSGVGTVNPAYLTAGALIGITNGDFTTATTWNTAGATNIINGTATLTEQSQKLSELTQAFIIPTGAKTLQFTIIDNHLVAGDTSKTANDAFEVALLDTNTFNPLAGTSQGLTNTDSLLNIQANGNIHKSDKVTITALGNNSSIVTIDLTQVTPSTQATLYFNLLGFGAKTSTVTIDDVKLFTDTQPIPVTKNDTLTTNQNTPLTLTTTQLTTNDTNVTQIQIINQPTHGTLTQTTDGKLTYQPIPTYVGNDSFTYLGFGSDGQISNLATVNLTVNNLPPTIQTLTIPTKINEGQTIQLSATATDGGNSNNLTYSWNLGDGTNPIVGSNIAHTYTDNGNYDITITVTDKDGGSTQQTTTVKVDNLAPIVNLTAPTTSLNQGESLNLGVTYSDPGIKDTHTITWNFGDGYIPVTGVTNPNHTFLKAGTNNLTVTVTDNDGASTTKSLKIAVANVALTIVSIIQPLQIKKSQAATFTATASDPGIADTLTYSWNFGDITPPVLGQNVNHIFANRDPCNVTLTVDRHEC